MPEENLFTQITQLQSAIQGLESQRPILGDTIVETSIVALRAQLRTLQAQHAMQSSASQLRAQLPVAGQLDLLHSYIPTELAKKMRATGHIEGERKQVTVVFADIAGFTSLSERLDPEEVAALTNEALKELAQVVYQYEGYIDKFIGDAIMAVFGAPIGSALLKAWY